MRSAAPEDVRVFQLMLNEKPVAGMSVVQFGQTAEYQIGWFGSDGRKLNRGNFLMWQVMRDLRTRDVTVFDLGGMSEGNGYSRSKRTMRPVEFKLADEWISFERRNARILRTAAVKNQRQAYSSGLEDSSNRVGYMCLDPPGADWCAFFQA